jgi:AcrR family transcriptional regulator
MTSGKSRDVEPGLALTPRRAGRERDILDCAKRLFAARGFEATAVSDIAAEVGVAEGTIYTYFESKRALLHRLIAEFYEPLIAEVEQAVRGITGVRNRIRYLAWRQFRAFAEEPELCYLIIRELQPAANAYDSIVIDLARRYTGIAVRVLQEAVEAGEVNGTVSPYLVRGMIYGTVENVAWRLSFRKKAIDIEQLSDEVAEILCRGILKRSVPESMSEAVTSLEKLVREVKAGVSPEAPRAARRITKRKTK